MSNRFHCFALRRLAGFGLLLWSAGAWAGADYYVESPSTSDRSQAMAQLESLPVLGDEIHPRVIRRFRVGEGWAYVIRVDALEEDQAQGVAVALTRGDEEGIVYRRIGSRTVRVLKGMSGTAEASPVSEAQTPESSEPVAPIEEPQDSEVSPNQDFEPKLNSAESTIDRVVRAHGGDGGGISQVEGAGSVYFSYTRTVATETETLIVDHEFVRWGEGLRLKVEVTEGEGVDSLTVVDRSGTAWILVDGQKTDRDPGQTSTVLTGFGPGKILGLSLHLAEQVQSDPRWSQMEPVANEASPGGERLVLRMPQGSGRGLVEVGLDAVQARLVSATWSTLDGVIRMEFENYQISKTGLVYPAQLAVWRDEALVERIRVHELELNQRVDSALFEAPESASPN